MATKYGRGGFRHAAAGTHGHTNRPVRRTLELKQRLLLIYIGILVFCVLILVFHGLGLQESLALDSPQTAMGTVTAKSDEGGAQVVTVQVEIPRPPEAGPGVDVLSESVRVTADSFQQVKVGDPIRVEFQVNRTRTYIRVLSLGAITLPETKVPPDHLEVERIPESIESEL